MSSVEGFGTRKHPDTAKQSRRARMKDERDKAARTRADEMHAAFGALTPEQQIATLDSRLGKGVGAVKQRARIVAKIAAKAKVAVMEVEAEVEKMNEAAPKKAKKTSAKAAKAKSSKS